MPQKSRQLMFRVSLTNSKILTVHFTILAICRNNGGTGQVISDVHIYVQLLRV